MILLFVNWWDTHVIKQTTDLHLQEAPEGVLERYMNFAAENEWDSKEARMQRVVTFMEQRRNLSLARGHQETDLAKRITEANRFKIRLTNMIRSNDPTSKILSWGIRKRGANRTRFQPKCPQCLTPGSRNGLCCFFSRLPANSNHPSDGRLIRLTPRLRDPDG